MLTSLALLSRACPRTRHGTAGEQRRTQTWSRIEKDLAVCAFHCAQIPARIGTANRQRDGYVHTQSAVVKITPGALKKGAQLYSPPPRGHGQAHPAQNDRQSPSDPDLTLHTKAIGIMTCHEHHARQPSRANSRGSRRQSAPGLVGLEGVGTYRCVLFLPSRLKGVLPGSHRQRQGRVVAQFRSPGYTLPPVSGPFYFSQPHGCTVLILRFNNSNLLLIALACGH